MKKKTKKFLGGGGVGRGGGLGGGWGGSDQGLELGR